MMLNYISTIKTMLKFNLSTKKTCEHRASDEEFYSGASESSSDDSSEELEEEDHTDNEVELDEEDWSREIGRRVDIEFSEEPEINVTTRNLKSCLDFLELFFTQEVWQLLVSQTNSLKGGLLP